jgi:hypothetical protein
MEKIRLSSYLQYKNRKKPFDHKRSNNWGLYMKAIISNKYGGPEVLGLNDVPKPVPNDNQVLVKVHAASLNKANVILLKGEPFIVQFVFGLTKPKHLIP